MGFILDNNIKAVIAGAKEFPVQLKQIASPPEKLFYRGKVLSKETCFAIVGTRKASDYGKKIAFDFAKSLSQAGLTIVSGMALGIDQAAHQGALAGNGRTIAVLASGLQENEIYPQENLSLAKEILKKGGALLSEKNKSTITFKSDFLQRNRLVAGLSSGVLVVECPLKSGALNTAAWAKKQGKIVFAIPGSIYWQNSRGPNSLLQKNGFLVQTPNDILKKLGFSKQKINEKNIVGLAKQETVILGALKNGPINIEQIIEKTGLKAAEVAIALTNLEAEDKIKISANNSIFLN